MQSVYFGARDAAIEPALDKLYIAQQRANPRRTEVLAARLPHLSEESPMLSSHFRLTVADVVGQELDLWTGRLWDLLWKHGIHT